MLCPYLTYSILKSLLGRLKKDRQISLPFYQIDLQRIKKSFFLWLQRNCWNDQKQQRQLQQQQQQQWQHQHQQQEQEQQQQQHQQEQQQQWQQQQQQQEQQQQHQQQQQQRLRQENFQARRKQGFERNRWTPTIKINLKLTKSCIAPNVSVDFKLLHNLPALRTTGTTLKTAKTCLDN